MRATLAPAGREQPREPQRQQGRPERDERLHPREPSAGGGAIGSGPMPQKRYLLTPGPTPVPPEVLAALGEPVLHHRGAGLPRRLRARPRRDCARCTAPASDVLLFTASGTGAFESAVVNLLLARRARPRRLRGAVRRALGGDVRAATAATVEPLRYAWGETPSPGRPRAHGSARSSRSRVVVLVHSETSTGVVADVQAARRRRRRTPAPSSSSTRSRASAPCRSRPTNGALDVVVSGSQKALMTPPGLGRSPSQRPRFEHARPCDAAALLLRLGARRAARRRSSTAPSRRPSRSSSRSTSRSAGCSTRASRRRSPGTPALGRACRAGVKAMGLELFSPDEDRSAVVTAARMPDGLDAVGAHARASRPARDHDRGRPGRAQGPDLPHRPHRLVRRVRHRDGALRGRARARGARRADRARRRRRRAALEVYAEGMPV